MTTGLRRPLAVDYLSHLEELRSRLLVCLAAVAVAVIVGWYLYPWVYPWLAAPVRAAVLAHDGRIIVGQPMAPFFLQMKFAFILGLLLASPLAIWQVWAFIRPGLTAQERRGIRPLLPAVTMLFLLGAGLAYLMLPNVMAFFLQFFPRDVSAYIDYQQSIDIPIKLMLAFGMAFQLPVVIIALVLLRIVTPGMLLAGWRYALVVMAIIAALVTPTSDPFNWSLMMLPLVILYFGTVLLAFRLVKSAPVTRKTGGDAV